MTLSTRFSFFAAALLSGVFLSHVALAVDAAPSPASTTVPVATHDNVTHHKFKGIVSALTPTSLTITKKKNNEIHVFQLSPETTVSLSYHRQGTLKDLAVGQQVQVQSSPDTQKAVHVYIHKFQDQKANECGCSACPSKEVKETKENSQK